MGRKAQRKQQERRSPAPASPAPRQETDEQPRARGTVTFHYIKSNQFRVIHVDGALGGVTPRLAIQMALFSERIPIPQQAVHEIDPATNALSDPPVDLVSKTGLVREVEVEAILDLSAARALAAWLRDNIERLETMLRGRS